MNLKTLKNHRFPIQIEGLPYIVGGLLLAIASMYVWSHEKTENPESIAVLISLFFTLLFSIFTLFALWFYRVPNIITPKEAKIVFSPANGRVLKVDEGDGKRIGEPRAMRISIFMSPFDVHVNRSPIDGKIEKISYNKGKFFKADLDKASDENENNWILMSDAVGKKVAFGQIAGFVARRIVCYVTEGEKLAAGERYGMIRFGSRMEVVVPVGSKPLVVPGDRTVAGMTKLFELP